jgi:hypothetical protein
VTPPAEPLTATVEYQLKQEDLVRALRYPTWGDPKGRKQVFRWWATGMLAVVGIAMLLGWLTGTRSLSLAVVPLVIALEWPLLLWKHPKGLAKTYSRQPGALEPVRMTVRQEALIVSSAKSELRMEWQAIREIAVTGEYTLFILGRFQVAAVPWRCFDSPSTAQRFSALARDHWLAAAAAPRSTGEVPADVEAALGPERVVVNYDLTMADVRALIAWQLRRKPRLWGALLVLALGFGGVAGLTSGLVNGVAAVLVTLAIPTAMIWGITLLSARSGKGVLGPHTLVAAPVGYWAVNPGVASSVQRWSSLTDIAANQRHLLLYRENDFVVGIPRRAFESPEAADRFLAQITRWRLAELAPSAPAPGV